MAYKGWEGECSDIRFYQWEINWITNSKEKDKCFSLLNFKTFLFFQETFLCNSVFQAPTKLITLNPEKNDLIL